MSLVMFLLLGCTGAEPHYPQLCGDTGTVSATHLLGEPEVTSDLEVAGVASSGVDVALTHVSVGGVLATAVDGDLRTWTAELEYELLALYADAEGVARVPIIARDLCGNEQGNLCGMEAPDNPDDTGATEDSGATDGAAEADAACLVVHLGPQENDGGTSDGGTSDDGTSDGGAP